MNKLTPEQVALAEANIQLLKKAESYWGYRLPYVSKDEIHDACVTAFIKTAKNFDSSFGTEFRLMYIYAADNEVKKIHRGRNAQKRSGVVWSLNKTLNVNNEEIGTLEDSLGREDTYSFFDREWLKHAFETLDDREKTCIQLAYFHNKSQVDIGKEFGCSQMNVSKIKKKALQKMRERALRIG